MYHTFQIIIFQKSRTMSWLYLRIDGTNRTPNGNPIWSNLLKLDKLFRMIVHQPSMSYII